MKVLIIAHGHPTLHKGGGEVAAYSIYKMLRADGHQAVFLGWSGQSESPGGDPIQKVGDDDYMLYTQSEHFHFSSTSTNLKLAIQALLNNYDFSVVHLHHYVHVGIEVASLIKQLAPRTRVILTLHEYLAICANNGQLYTKAGEVCEGYSPQRCNACFPGTNASLFFMRELAIKAAFSFIDHFLSPSEFLRQQYLQWGIPPIKITTIENPLPLQLAGEIVNIPPPTAGQRWKIGFFGQINFYKGLDVLLDGISSAVAQGTQVEIGIHGKISPLPEFPHYVEHLQESIKSLGNHAIFHGGYQQDEVQRIMRNYHFVAMGSRWYENSPVVIQEAISAGRPLIVPAHGGMQEKGERISLDFVPSDAASMAKVLVNLTKDTYKNLQIAAADRRRELKIERDESYAETLSIYRSN